MAYKQKQTPFKQEKGYSAKLGKAIEENTTKNKQFKEVENKAKGDSISAANSYKGNVFKKRKAGNEAANVTRKAGGVAPVERFSNPHEYNTYQPRTGEKDTYIRKAPVEKDVPMARNPKTGELDVKPYKSPAKQMETIKKVVSKAKEIGGKIVKGVKKMDKALEGKSDTRSFDAKDTFLGRRSTGARTGEKTSPAKMKISKTPAKMKKC